MRHSFVQVGEDWFRVYLIPETMRISVLGIKQKGDDVNIEIDAQTQAIVTAVERHLSRVVEGQIALNSSQGVAAPTG
jgi:riboflavin synthase alpha subunit